MKEVQQWVYGVISEASLFGFLYYVQYLLSVEGNLWVSSLLLWALLNGAIVFCPVLRCCTRQGKR